MMIRNFFLTLLAGCAVSWPLYVSACNEAPPQCIEIVKECFVKEKNKKDNCFYSTANHPFCEGTALAELALKRWSLSSGHTIPEGESPRFSMGSHIIDPKCLSNFDNHWSSQLLEQELSESDLKNLNQALSLCKKNISNGLVRP